MGGRELLARLHVLTCEQVTPDPARCVQCGCCSYNCPLEIDVRGHARRGIPIQDSRCITCGECVKRCPRGVLQFAPVTSPSLGM